MEACLGLEAFVTPARVRNKDIISVAGHWPRMSARTVPTARQPVSFSGHFIAPSMPNSRSWVASHALSAPSGADGAQEPSPSSMLEFVELAHQLADAAGEILLKYFRKRIEITDKEDLSPVTIADQAAEQAMRSLVSKRFPSHAIFGEEWGLESPTEDIEFVWVLDPIDGTKSFITGKPVFGTLISLLYREIPIIGIIDQPVLRERWVGVKGKKSILNGEEIETRLCSSLSNAYLYTTSPHLFLGAAAEAFSRVRDKVKVPLYGCDCYAYGLLAAGHVDLVIESGLKPYDFLALVPVVEGAGGLLTDWKGQPLRWWPSPAGKLHGTDVIAAGDKRIYEAALAALHGN
ncbi:hypothetical protein GOP47_0005229 [Adiantum capillus-veneris]|uniref:histidinol-phosphatase n=1 Tax=Adiantum capillus-veneris TaxID=13818 RepID=A0A9D4ZNY5_ADICA|nr:hypothetical protein GOP47_0005229 [Adiantum capillus-veneris]